ncbi:hypothetical protein M422DRAFT_252986 [Sphaerobolus stellatus SS14]|uniref:Uncharacterized protein n=1 Tax=Sphaerobolus stellatus (strain SS14) TaxID=990650 RepID=A0A0C9UKZ2_SPHS4|nr:hypothetical protein M422DRAFT_252986 [Sphaerobolus stellatus SS14]
MAHKYTKAPPSTSTEVVSVIRKRKVEVEEKSAAVEETKKTTTIRRKPKLIVLLYDEHVTRVRSPWKVGAHMPADGGAEHAVWKAASIGANAFALFLKKNEPS